MTYKLAPEDLTYKLASEDQAKHQHALIPSSHAHATEKRALDNREHVEGSSPVDKRAKVAGTRVGNQVNPGQISAGRRKVR